MTASDDPAVSMFLRALGKRVRLLRLTREWTQADLGCAVGMSRSFVSLLEQGGSGADVVRLLRLARALGVTLSELVDLPGASPPAADLVLGPDRVEGLPS